MLMNNKKTASVIIPAFNEEKHIQNTLQALTMNNDLEIIVVDNGSADQTAEIANQAGINVIDFPSGTIAAVRNRGVRESLLRFSYLLMRISEYRLTGMKS